LSLAPDQRRKYRARHTPSTVHCHVCTQAHHVRGAPENGTTHAHCQCVQRLLPWAAHAEGRTARLAYRILKAASRPLVWLPSICYSSPPCFHSLDSQAHCCYKATGSERGPLAFIIASASNFHASSHLVYPPGRRLATLVKNYARLQERPWGVGCTVPVLRGVEIPHHRDGRQLLSTLGLSTKNLLRQPGRQIRAHTCRPMRPHRAFHRFSHILTVGTRTSRVARPTQRSSATVCYWLVAEGFALPRLRHNWCSSTGTSAVTSVAIGNSFSPYASLQLARRRHMRRSQAPLHEERGVLKTCALAKRDV
jgi:hypothetical protein